MSYRIQLSEVERSEYGKLRFGRKNERPIYVFTSLFNFRNLIFWEIERVSNTCLIKNLWSFWRQWVNKNLLLIEKK